MLARPDLGGPHQRPDVHGVGASAPPAWHHYEWHFTGHEARAPKPSVNRVPAAPTGQVRRDL